MAARQREITLEQRNVQKELLKQQLADEKEKLKAAKDTLQQSKLDTLAIQKETFKEQFDALMSSENLQAEAMAYRLIKNGNIKHLRFGKVIKIPKKFLVDYIMNECHNE